jgi:hypothetical protein
MAAAIGVNWGDPAAYAAIIGCGRSGLAWEVLRRDLAYQAAFASVDRSRPADSAFVARWGLHFR